MTARIFIRCLLPGITLILLATACGEDVPLTIDPPYVSVVAEGLINPLGLTALPDGGVLIAEEGTGQGDNSAGLSVLTSDGRVGRVVDGLPSSRDAGDLSGAPLAGVSPDGRTAYVAHFGAPGLLTFPIPEEGLQPATKANPALQIDELTPTMTRLNEVFLVNPFDITFDTNGVPVVTDASGNGLATAKPDGTVIFTHRFGKLNDPQQGSLKIDAVPTGVTRVEDEYYVTLTGGCPYPAGAGVVVAAGPERAQRTVATGLNMPIDVERGPSGSIWLLEFAQFDPDSSCFSGEGYRPETGRLSRLEDDGSTTTVLTGLDFPGSVIEDTNGDLYVTEIFSGRLLRLSWEEQPATAPAQPEAATTPWVMRDVAGDQGIDFVHGAFATGLSDDPTAAMGGGLCWIDYNSDGWLDLYVVNSHALAEVEYWGTQGGLPHNELFHNDEGRFRRVGTDAGVAIAHRGNGCVAADFDGDGATDIFVTADGPNVMFHNRGDGSFEDVSEDSGTDTNEWNSAAVVGDLNGDARPELFVGSYIDLDLKIEKPSGAFPQDFVGIPDRLFANLSSPGSIRFEEITNSAQLDRDERTLGALLSDVDLDGDLDLYIANDGHPNRLYRNDSSASDDTVVMTDVTIEVGVGDSGSGMGVAGGDYDRNGAFDILVTNWEAELNALYANESSSADMSFSYMTQRIGLAGLGNNKTGWGVAWVDLDQDTDLDMLIVHGRVPVTDLDSDPELVRFYANQLAEGKPGTFRDLTAAAGLDAVGPLLARGSAVADFDNDGDPDVAINTIGGPLALLENVEPGGHWIQLALAGSPPGTRVSVGLESGEELTRELYTGSSYLSSEDPRLHFGLGDYDGPVTATVHWPDGSTGKFSDLTVDTQHELRRDG
ncbi:MAG: ScyD/ScyE family protein [Acidimicrobiia bacterium]|nr:ScyD/ScyE family protein [Acidimicrobiia bacterium]